jgi:hypothetical protein
VKGRRRGWAAEPSFRSPHRIGAPLEKGPGAAAGALLFLSAEKLALFRRTRAGMIEALVRYGESAVSPPRARSLPSKKVL